MVDRRTVLFAGLAFVPLVTPAVRLLADEPPLSGGRSYDDGWQVLSLAFSPDGKWLATGNADLSAKIRDARTGRVERTLTPGEGIAAHVMGVAFTPDGKMLATLAGRQVQVWDTATGKLVRTLSRQEGTAGRLMCLALSPDGKSVAAGGSSWLGGFYRYPSGKVGDSPGQVWLWDVPTGNLRATLNHDEGGEVVSLAFSPDGQLLAGGSQAGTLRLWDAAEGIARLVVPAQSGPVWALAFSPDGKTLASGGADNLISLWDPQTGKELRTLKGHGHLILSLAFSPDGERLASGSYDETLRLWDPRSGALALTLPLGGWVQVVRFSPDGKTLAAGLHRETGALRLWDVARSS